MSEVWSNPANWTTVQWMSVAIMAFVIIAILVMVHRLLTIVQLSRKQPYKPNLRRLRKSPERRVKSDQEASDKEN